MQSFSVTREAPPQPSPKGRETAYTGKKTTEHFLSHLKMLTLVAAGLTKSDGTEKSNDSGDCKSPLQAMKKQ